MADLATAAAEVPAPPPSEAPVRVSAVEPGGVPPVPPPSAPEGTKTELGAAPPKSEAPPAAAVFDPAKLTVPEGMKSDDPLFKSFAEVMSDTKLDPQTRGQKLLDVYKEGVRSVQEASHNAWKTTNEGWVNEVKNDPEIGGAKFEPTKATIAKAIDSLGPELSVAFRQGLDATGAGNHPAIWKGLAKMAALLTEGGHVSGTPPKGAPDLKATFFPNSNMK